MWERVQGLGFEVSGFESSNKSKDSLHVWRIPPFIVQILKALTINLLLTCSTWAKNRLYDTNINSSTLSDLATTSDSLYVKNPLVYVLFAIIVVLSIMLFTQRDPSSDSSTTDQKAYVSTEGPSRMHHI